MIRKGDGMKRYRAVVGGLSVYSHRIDYEERKDGEWCQASEVDAEMKRLRKRIDDLWVRKRIDDLYPVAAYRCEAHEDEEAAGICPCCERVEVARLRAALDLSVRGELEETARRKALEEQVEALRAWHLHVVEDDCMACQMRDRCETGYLLWTRARECGALPIPGAITAAVEGKREAAWEGWLQTEPGNVRVLFTYEPGLAYFRHVLVVPLPEEP